MKLIRFTDALKRFCFFWTYKKIGISLTLFAVASFFIRLGRTGGYFGQPFEIIIIFTAIFLLMGAIARDPKKKIDSELSFWIAFFMALVILLFAGLALGVKLYGLTPVAIFAVMKDFYLFGAVALGFLLMIHYG